MKKRYGVNGRGLFMNVHRVLTRRAMVLACSVALGVGFAHAVLTAPEPTPAVQCFEDGSCTNGWCDPRQLCHDATEPQR